MHALVWDGNAAAVVDRPPPRLTPGMALVRVALAGICNTDLELTRGYMDFRGILGHEFTGTVVDGPDEWRGRRVVAEINFGCRKCTYCFRGLQRHCLSRRVLGILDADGAFAETVAVPLENLHAVPREIPDEVAVFVEPLAAAFEILEQVHVQPQMECVVLGDGKLGLLVSQVLHQTGAHVLAVGKHEDKLGILRRRGIDAVLLDQWQRAPADLVVEATGSAEGVGVAIAVTKPRGTLVLKSTVADPATLSLAPLVINEVSIVGSRCGSFTPALRALASGSVDVLPLIAKRLPLDEGAEGLRVASAPGVLKVLLEI